MNWIIFFLGESVSCGAMCLEEKVKLSIIIPVRDRADSLKRCLESLKKSYMGQFEVIVVDDCSQKDCSEMVREYGYKALRLDKRFGSWYARNKGAELAGGDVLLFLDGDMLLQPNTLNRIHNFFSSNHYAALSGICSGNATNGNLATQYKNLWMHYSYLRSPENFDWFISGIGAVKREVFFELKGFDVSFETKTGGGDLEFGRRLKKTGQEIFLDKQLQAEHLKQHTLFSLIRNDYNRSKGWFKLILGKKLVGNVVKKLRIANIYPSFIISVFAVFLLFLSLFLSFWSSKFLLLTIISGIIYLMVNYPLFRFLQKRAGKRFLIKAIPLSMVDHLVSGIGVVAGGLSYLGSRRGK
jgi:glycosyltransferase involved in cell wall biosynthesis